MLGEGFAAQFEGPQRRVRAAGKNLNAPVFDIDDVPDADGDTPTGSHGGEEANWREPWPRASWASRPSISTAAVFQLVTRSCMSRPMIASPEDSIIAESRRRAASRCFRSVMSLDTTTTVTKVPGIAWTGLIMAKTGKSRPARCCIQNSPVHSLPAASPSRIPSPDLVWVAGSSAPGMMPRSMIFRPITSAAEHPYSRSEAWFQY